MYETGTSQRYANGTLANRVDGASSTDRVLLLDETTSNIRQHTERVRECIGFVRTLADGIFGPNPTGENGKAILNGSFRADGLRGANSDLYSAISELSVELDRLKAL